VTGVPVTTQPRRLPSRVRIAPPEGASCRELGDLEQVRTVPKKRLSSRWGSVAPATMRKVSTIVPLLLDRDDRGGFGVA
jgi:mRNA-degrading endonuclease toxin of MazEF toxin-antitoxin module